MEKMKYVILGVVLVLSCASCGNNNSGTELPAKNFQANGNSELQNCNIYYSDSYPEYLFVFSNEEYVIYAR